MAQPIAPEVWQEGIEDYLLLPGRHVNKIFTGNNGIKNIANNPEATRVWSINVSDYITDYDDRRINGLSGKNAEGRDGWGASAWGVFQDVRFTSRLYKMSRHRSVAFRLYDEMQHSGPIGDWGTETKSNVITNGQSLMKTAQLITKAKDIWEKQVLDVDIDKYCLFAIFNGHMSGRWVADNPDVIFDGEGHWVAEPGMVQGQSVPPAFAPIHALEFDDENILAMLHTIRTTWNNLFIPEDNRVIIMDPFYQFKMMKALIGDGVPPTEAAYADVRDGNFTRLMGWDFDFTIPSQYWPQLYLDDNLNVVHSKDGTATYDAIINSVAGGDNPDLILQNQLVAADRMHRNNFIRTIWNDETGKFEKKVTNYPLGMPATVPYLGVAEDVPYENYGLKDGDEYPWTRDAGYGLADPTGPVGDIVRRQTIGCAVYRPAAQLSQEYSEMRTEDGGTRGKFTEMVMDVKYDAWVCEPLAAGIMPIIDAKYNTGVMGIPVKVVEDPQPEPAITSITVSPTTKELTVGQEAALNVTVKGVGKYDTGWTAYSEDSRIVAIDGRGVMKAVTPGSTTVKVRSIQDSTAEAEVSVTVKA